MGFFSIRILNKKGKKCKRVIKYNFNQIYSKKFKEYIEENGNNGIIIWKSSIWT